MKKSYIDKLALILTKGKKVLMTRSYGKDSWFTPGGKREKGETDDETLIREIKEELSVALIPQTIKYYGSFEAQAHGKPEGILVKIICYTASFKGKLKPSGEIEKIDFFSYNQRDLVSAVGKLIFDDLKTRGLIG